MAFNSIRRLRVSPEEVPAGGLVRIECEVVDKDGTLVTPGTTKQFRIFHKVSNAEVSGSPFAATADATGLLSYNYTTVTSLPHSAYDVRAETNDGTDPAKADLPDAFATVPL